MGGVSGRPSSAPRAGAILSTEGETWRWKASRPSGSRCPSRGAGRTRASVGPRRRREHPLSQARAPATADVPRDAEEGNVVGVRPFKAHAPDARADNATCAPEDASFTRSSDPCASIVTTHRRRKAFGGGAVAAISRSGKPAQAGGTGSGVAETGRSAARRSTAASAREKALSGQNRKVVEAIVPARNESRGSLPARRSTQLQKSVGGIWPRISSAHALQKERTGSSERGPSRGERRR